jgi:phenylalanine-4-hydroxylase
MANRPDKQIYSDYTPEDFLVWKTLYNRQMDILHTTVSKSYLEAIDIVRFVDYKIPDFSEVNSILQNTTGWRIEVVPNICPDARFFECSANRIFTSTCWLRTMEQLDYLEEPDMFHDVFGHMPLLSNTNYANFFSDFGKIALKFIGNPEAIQLLSRIYWYTIEFGLIKENDAFKIYGAGIISSFGETKHAIDNTTEKIKFDVEKIIDTPYRTDIIQDKYFVIDSFEELYSSLPEIERAVAARI